MSAFYVLGMGGLIGTNFALTKFRILVETGKWYFSAMTVKQKYVQLSESFAEVMQWADGLMREVIYDLGLEG